MWNKFIKQLVISALILMPILVNASEKEENFSWTEVTGYVYATSINGDLGISNIDLGVDVSFKKILENLDFAAMAYLEHRKNKWGFLSSIFYADLSSDSDIATNGSTTALLSTELDQLILEGFGTYRVFQKEYDFYKKIEFDVGAGLRYNYIKSELGVEATDLGLSNSLFRKNSVNWVDPAIGVRIQYHPALRWGLSLWVDYGGFGIEADNTYQVVASVKYNINKKVKLFGGWRHYHFRYSEGSGQSRFSFDADYTGPMIGLSYRF